MVLVIALPDCALRLSKVLSGARYVVQVADGKELRHRVHEHQPDVVVLDWRMGGSAWRAIDEVPAIVSRTATHPRVVAIVPSGSRKVDSHAVSLGCYDVVSALSRGWDRAVYEAVRSACQERAPSSDRLSRSDLH